MIYNKMVVEFKPLYFGSSLLYETDNQNKKKQIISSF